MGWRVTEGSLKGSRISVKLTPLAAYLLVFMPARRKPFPLFSSHVKPQAAPDYEDDSRAAGPSSHEVHTLRDIHAIPLVPELATRALDRLGRIQVSSWWSF